MGGFLDSIFGSKADEIPKDKVSLQKKLVEISKQLDIANEYDMDSGKRYPSQTSVSKAISSDMARVAADKKYLLKFKTELQDALLKAK
jgi:hypothetical protein